MDNQITVSRLLNMLDELSMNGFGDMPVFLGENYPLLEDSISVNPSENKLYIRNTYYDKKMAEAIKKAINGMEDVRRAYIADCYKAGRRMDEKEREKRSIKSAFESEGIDFSQVMNPPEPWDGRALIKNINGKLWYCCPFCQKKALLISPDTKIQHLKLKCKGSNCKKEFEVNV